MPENHDHTDGDRRAQLQREQSTARMAERIADEAAARAIEQTFRLLGHDIKNQEAINDLRRDLDYVRHLREAAEGRSKSIATTALTTVVGGVVTAILALLAGWIKIGGR